MRFPSAYKFCSRAVFAKNGSFKRSALISAGPFSAVSGWANRGRHIFCEFLPQRSQLMDAFTRIRNEKRCTVR